MIAMEKIEFKPRKKTSKIPFIAVSIALVCTAVFLAVKDNQADIAGFAVTEGQFAASQEEPADEAPEKAYIAEDKTPEGLIVRYGNIKQGIAEIGLPVKWEQEITVENPSDNAVRDAAQSFFVPKDAKNIVIFLDGERISSSTDAIIPEVRPKDSIKLKIAFETSPVQMEFIEENGATKVRFWQDSGMIYRNVLVQMDIKLGEQIVETVNGAEKEIVFDYANGKAGWTIKEM